MVTQELIAYMRAEVNRGKTREEISRNLLAGGGWSEADVVEAFKDIMPSGGIINPIFASPTTQPAALKPKRAPMSKAVRSAVIFALLAAVLCGSGYFFRSDVKSIASSAGRVIGNMSFPKFGLSSKEAELPLVKTTEAPSAAMPKIEEIKDCGTTVAPDPKNTTAIMENATLSCLGERAVNCLNAKGVLKSDIFPTSFEVIHEEERCDFQLSYGSDTQLKTPSGYSLALQYVTCPIRNVKRIDETDPQKPVLKQPTKENFPLYASEIYQYGTVGLFLEKNFERTRIHEELSCTGSFIDSVIESYKASLK
jgi:hypothetical protein